MKEPQIMRFFYENEIRDPEENTINRKTLSVLFNKNPVFFLLFPALLIIALVLLYPLLYSLIMSFMEWNVPYDRKRLLGVRNFVRLVVDKSFQRAFINNAYFAVICLTVELSLGFFLAQLLTKNFVGKNVVRILLLIPFLAAPTLAGLEFRWIYNREYGLLNHILEATGLFSKQSWLFDPMLAFISVMVVDIWQHTPFMMLLLLAGLETLPISPYEAATVDGATWIQKFRYLTVPLLKPVIAIACMLRIIDLFRVFDIIFIITQGGPAGRTELLSVYLYRTAFQYGKLGYAAAGSWYTLLFSLLIILPILDRMRKLAG